MAAREHSVDTLVSLFQEELAAVQGYGQALARLEHARARDKLRELCRDHERRAGLLRERLELLGRTPPDTQGRGSGFSRLPHLSSTGLGVTAQSVLHSVTEGEEYALQDYEAKLPSLDEETRRFVEDELLAAQRRTHGAARELQRTLH